MIAGIVLAAMVVLAGVSDRTGPVGAGLLAVASIAWLVVNDPMEGPVLVYMTENHGVTVADLAGLAGLGVAGWRLIDAPRR